MDAVWMFLVGVGMAAVGSLAVVWYLKPYLQEVLVDLCGTVQRAAFWTAFVTVAMVLTPIVFAMHYRPDPAANGPVLFALGSQLELALLGLLLCMLLLGGVMSKFIPRSTK